MKKQHFAIVAVFAAAMLVSAAARALDIMPVKDIKPGMKGIGYSVFKGTKPDQFNAEIIAVLPKWETGMPMILARLSGANLEFSGVVAGMSGSPVYIDGKLIGAVAYAWYFAKEPVCGIQPIENMLRLWNEPSVGPKSESAAVTNREPFAYTLAGSMDARDSESGQHTATAVHTSSDINGDIELTPIMTPLLLSNMPASAASYLKKHLAKFNLVPVEAGGGSDQPDKEGMDALCPGCVIGSPLMTGDFTMTAIGTVTARDGDKLLAFGHPFFNGGPSALPLSGGEIFHVMSILTNSMKYGSPGNVIGAITDDRSTAIAGSIGAKADFFPVSIVVTDADAGRTKTFNVQIAQVRDIVPYLLLVTIGRSVESAAGLPEQNITSHIVIDAEIEGYDKPLHLDDMAVQPPDTSGVEPMSYIADLLNNPFRQIRLKNVKVNLTVERNRKYYFIEDASLDSSEFRPGDRVKAFLKLKSYDEKESTRTIEFRIPQNAEPGQVILEFDGGGSQTGIPSSIPPVSFDQMFDLLERWIPQNAVTVKFIYQDKSIGVGGSEIQDLPLSVNNTFSQGNFPQQQLFNRYDRTVLKTDNVVIGKATAQINIEKEFNQ